MIITCPGCHTRFNLPDDTVQNESTRVRCSRCRHVFGVAHPMVSEPSGRQVPGQSHAPPQIGATPSGGSPSLNRVHHTQVAKHPGAGTGGSRCVVMAVTNQKGGVA